MEFFKSILRAMGFLSDKVDFLADLPLEVSQLILRELEPESLLSVAQVSRKWRKVCRSDPILRRRARHHLREEKRRILEARPHYRPQPDRRIPAEQKTRTVFPVKVQALRPETDYQFEAPNFLADGFKSRRPARKGHGFQAPPSKPKSHPNKRRNLRI